ncbi:MAG TPA: NUDIX domain-containing protein [Verrucomicrobiae bacterium]|nr:NUDIX domain-containing protein [Verrucomicrobiae bacterium]
MSIKHKDFKYSLNEMNFNEIVITSILENNGKILLLRRSEKVKSFRLMWAGISGYLEQNEDLLSRALIEIKEETGINKNDLVLMKILNYKVVEIVKNRIIKIQPFYFYSKTRNISLDWEHCEIRWILKTEIGGYNVVPKLIEIIKECN